MSKHMKRQVKCNNAFYWIVLFITQACVLFLVQLRWLKKNDIYDIVSINIKRALNGVFFFSGNNLPHVIWTMVKVKEIMHNLN